jgi:hypothetical protein
MQEGYNILVRRYFQGDAIDQLLPLYDYKAGSITRRSLLETPPYCLPLTTYNPAMKKNGNMLLDSILEPVTDVLNDKAAQKLLDLKADRKTQARVSKLADKCNEGQLTPDERREYEMYLMANHIVAILKAKARVRLARKGQPA